MKILGIIPARSGSERILNKNLREFMGKPLLAWSIESAKKSALDKVVVSTDGEDIANLAKKYGAEVPFIRPKELAKSTSGIEPVLRHAYEWFKDNEGYIPDAVALIHSTNPSRTAEHINAAIDIFEQKKPDSVVSVIEAKANHNPHWILKRDQVGGVSLFTGVPLKDIPTRSQDLPPAYIRNDIIYILRPENLYEEKPNLYGNKVELMVMDDFTDIDLNTEEDWFVAEQKMKWRSSLNG